MRLSVGFLGSGLLWVLAFLKAGAMLLGSRHGHWHVDVECRREWQRAKDKGNGAEKRARVKRQAPLRNASTYLAEVKLGILANASASLVAASSLIRLEAKLRA